MVNIVKRYVLRDCPEAIIALEYVKKRFPSCHIAMVPDFYVPYGQIEALIDATCAYHINVSRWLSPFYYKEV